MKKNYVIALTAALLLAACGQKQEDNGTTIRPVKTAIVESRSEINKDFLEVAGSEFEFLKQRANDVISEMIVTLRGINKLLSDNSANLNATIGNVAAITGDLRSVVADEKGSLRETISNVNDLSRTLRDKTGQIDRIFLLNRHFCLKISIPERVLNPN